MNENKPELNEAVLKRLRAVNWGARALTAVALGIGMLCIAGGMFLVWANTHIIFPQVQSLVKGYHAAPPGNTNAVSGTAPADERFTLGDGKTVDRQVLVTLMMGKSLNVTSLAVALLGFGTLLTLLLVIFNRRVTLRQINIHLAQISEQIKELKTRPGPERA